MLLQQSSLEVMKTWMSVSAAGEDTEGCRKAMFLSWKKEVFLIWLTWGQFVDVRSEGRVGDGRERKG